MKLKTEQEIEEIADIELSHLWGNHGKIPREGVRSLLIYVLEKFQEDMIKGASEGFEEWKAHNLSCHESARIHDLCERSYQAAKLSSARELELIKKDHKNEEDCWLITVESKDEKITELQKEIEELKKSVKLQKDINQSEALLNTSLHRERLKLENEIMQLREDLEWALCSYNPRYLGDEEKCKEIIKRHGLDKSEDMASKKEV